LILCMMPLTSALPKPIQLGLAVLLVMVEQAALLVMEQMGE
jgi:hypothetical protein